MCCAIQKFSWREKNKTLVKIMGGRQHRTTPAGQILGVATPATPAALTPMHGAAYVRLNFTHASIVHNHANCPWNLQPEQWYRNYPLITASNRFRQLVLRFPVTFLWSRIFRSCIFRYISSFLVLHFQVLHFQSTRILFIIQRTGWCRKGGSYFPSICSIVDSSV